MKYNFKMIDFSYGTLPKGKVSYDYGVDYDSLDDSEKSLFQIAWSGWTPQEIQMIIDKSEALLVKQEYDYQVVGSDLLISIDKENVHFFDSHSEQQEADMIWPYDKFIEFMKEFKKIVEENS